jgi:uncharacterized phage protein gp47/JayE
MNAFGVTEDGFTIKGFDAILRESQEHARQIFGTDVDLTPSSPIYQILLAAAAEDAELWKRMEDLYYSNFISTAVGDALDALGEDLGVKRQQLFASGTVTFTVQAGSPPGASNVPRRYTFPEGTIVIATTSGGPVLFYTTETLTLSDLQTQGNVVVKAFEPGSQGNIDANQVSGIDPAFLHIMTNLAGTGTTVQVANAEAFTGGEQYESDGDYRTRLLGLPRNMWTLESVRRAALDVTGVIDVLPSDSLGGVDVSLSYFNLFNFNERRFSSQRQLGEPYFFDVTVAHEIAWPWRNTPVQLPGGATITIPGVYERVLAAIDRVRPIGIHPNIVEADLIEVGVRATVTMEPGHDVQSLIASIKQSIAIDIGTPKLGNNVLFSQIMRAFGEQPGVVDVQNLHLRRCPAAFGRITFGSAPFQATVFEAAVGENLAMGPTEIAFFRLDSGLIEIEVVKH